MEILTFELRDWAVGAGEMKSFIINYLLVGVGEIVHVHVWCLGES